jgi:acyl-CoA thioesterase
MKIVIHEQHKHYVAQEVVEKMLVNDPFSQWLGIQKISVEPGKCVLKMLIKKEMLNGFGILHGGVTFSLADSAFAFASNSRGKKAYSIDNNISYLTKVNEGDELTAKAEEISLSDKIGIYNVTVLNKEQQIVALFKGTVYRSSENW